MKNYTEVKFQYDIEESGNSFSKQYRIKISYLNRVYHDFKMIAYKNDKDEVSFFIDELFKGVISTPYKPILMQRLRESPFEYFSNHLVNKAQLLEVIEFLFSGSKPTKINGSYYTKRTLLRELVIALFDFIEFKEKIVSESQEEKVITPVKVQDDWSDDDEQDEDNEENYNTLENDSNPLPNVASVEEDSELLESIKDNNSKESTVVTTSYNEDFESIDGYVEVRYEGFHGTFAFSIAKDKDGKISPIGIDKTMYLIHSLEDLVNHKMLDQ